MKIIFPRLILPSMALAMGVLITACGSDNNVTSAGAIPRATATASASPSASATATDTATPTASPTGSATATPNGSPTATPSEVFVRGEIRAIINGTVFNVGGQDFVTDAGTTFNRNGLPATAADFHVGERVRVLATMLADGTLHAERLNFPED